MSTEPTTHTSQNSQISLTIILQLLHKACANYEAGKITQWSADYAALPEGYKAGDLIFSPEDQDELLLSTIDNNHDDPAQGADSWQAVSTGLLGLSARSASSPIGPQDDILDKFMTVEKAETLYYPLKGGTLHGKMIVDKIFTRNKETLTQPLGTIFGDVEFFLQLANHPSLGKMFGRLVIRDKDGNEHIGVQVESDGTVTDGADQPLITRKEAEGFFILKSNYHPENSAENPDTKSSTPAIPNGGELFITATDPHDDETVTKPLGAQIGSMDPEQFYLQLADNSATDQVYGRLGLVNKDGDRFQVLEAEEDGSIVPKEGYRVLEISQNTSTPMKLLAFTVYGKQTVITVNFPEAFSASPMVNITGSHTHSNPLYKDRFYFASLNNNTKTNLSPDINHASFTASIGGSDGDKAATDYTLSVIAIGPA